MIEVIHKKDAEFWAKYSICPPAEIFKQLLNKLKEGQVICRNSETNEYYISNINSNEK